MNTTSQVRCWRCNKLIGEVSVGALVRTKCPRCHVLFETEVGKPAAR